jgi:hypothetical protein
MSTEKAFEIALKLSSMFSHAIVANVKVLARVGDFENVSPERPPV